MKERVKWIDVAKLLVIFLIFTWHLGEDVMGRAYSYIGLFHVPVFFFLSGCTENYNKENNFNRYFIKEVKELLLPFLFFGILSLIFEALNRDLDGETVIYWCKILIKGAPREWYMAYQLWFLSALFVTKLVFKLLEYTKNRAVMLLVSLLIFFVAHNYLNTTYQNLPWNLYWVALYMVFYAIGYVVYPSLADFFKLDTRTKRHSFNFSVIVTFIYSFVVIYYDEPINARATEAGLVGGAAFLARTIFTGYFIICIAKELENVSVFAEVGKDTLWLCGSEFIIKRVVVLLLDFLGLQFLITTPVTGFIYAFLLIIILEKIFVPVEKEIYYSIAKIVNFDSHLTDYN